MDLPFQKLRLQPSSKNKVANIIIDKELGSKAISYTLENGKSDSIHLDAFLDYNVDPEHLRKLTLYKITLEAQKLVTKSKLSKREIARRLKTSPSQLYRLLDQTNHTKTIDSMLSLLAIFGAEIEVVKKAS